VVKLRTRNLFIAAQERWAQGAARVYDGMHTSQMPPCGGVTWMLFLGVSTMAKGNNRQQKNVKKPKKDKKK